MLLRGLDLGLQALAGLLLTALLLCVLAGVVTRAAGDPLSWTDEGARFLMVWLAATGWMLAGRRRGHVRIRFFQNLLPRRAWAVSETVIQLGTAVFGAVVAFYGVALVLRNLDLDATSLPISMAWLYAALIPAGALTAVQSAIDAVRHPRLSPSPLAETAVE